MTQTFHHVLPEGTDHAAVEQVRAALRQALVELEQGVLAHFGNRFARAGADAVRSPAGV